MNQRIPGLAASGPFLVPGCLEAVCGMVTVRSRAAPACLERVYGLHAPVVKLACGLLPQQAGECLELCVYISRATVCKSREQTDSKEFTGQAALTSSLEGFFSAHIVRI